MRPHLGVCSHFVAVPVGGVAVPVGTVPAFERFLAGMASDVKR